jgi:hypothetical protein
MRKLASKRHLIILPFLHNLVMKNQTQKTLKIAAMGMDNQTRRMLEMVFHGPGKGSYFLVEQLSEAQAGIVDLDTFQATESWQNYRHQYPHLPTILLSLHHKDIAGTIYVKKPIDVNELLKALSKIKREVEERTSVASISKKHSSTTPPRVITAHDAKLDSEIALEEEEDTLHQFCGYNADINPERPDEIEKIYYDPSQYLQGFLDKALHLGKEQAVGGGVLIEGLHTPIILLPHSNQILHNYQFNDSQLRTMALLPMSSNQLRMTAVSEIEVSFYLSNHSLVGYSLESFVWRIALWTARGRLPKGTDLHKDIVLLHWPNFPRLVVTPQALRISAFWLAEPHSLVETAQLLKVAQRYVFAFYSATSALKLALVDRRADRQRSQSKVLVTANEKRSLLQRLLARLHIKNDKTP